MRLPDTLLEVNNLKMYFPITEGLFARLKGYTKAADDVSLFIRKGETLGLVGESGCGKTTVGRCIVRAYTPTAGQILYKNADDKIVDLAPLDRKTVQPYRKEIRMIFQDPYSSLNPRMTVFDIISEALKVNKLMSQSEMEDRVEYILQRVGLRPEYIKRYPHAFSGGERQRIGIARALVTNPRLIVADEAVSALDVSIRAQILNLMEELQRDFDLTYLFVSHDLSVIRHICNRVVVMYVGKVVEIATGLDIYMNPKHPYTEALMSAVPVSNPRARDKGARIRLPGEVADPSNPPPGCYFHPRCRYAKEQCSAETPVLRDMGNDHFVACHFAEELTLTGVRMA
ncbi:MAG TPA: ATP-binding cassette domain-containing protein [Anaerolineae bacterium]|nr:ATP-binding cassette domain-containing protein [Anaerolineae bacterium]HQI87313.1 ATP-binding cassette domain-containing protein [Anaerolineae bacterium]